jgi:hypothetical protein
VAKGWYRDLGTSPASYVCAWTCPARGFSRAHESVAEHAKAGRCPRYVSVPLVYVRIHDVGQIAVIAVDYSKVLLSLKRRTHGGWVSSHAEVGILARMPPVCQLTLRHERTQMPRSWSVPCSIKRQDVSRRKPYQTAQCGSSEIASQSSPMRFQ